MQRCIKAPEGAKDPYHLKTWDGCLSSLRDLQDCSGRLSPTVETVGYYLSSLRIKQSQFAAIWANQCLNQEEEGDDHLFRKARLLQLR